MRETRPIREQVLASLDNLESEVRAGFRRFERDVGTPSRDVLEVRADRRDPEKRMDETESRAP